MNLRRWLVFLGIVLLLGFAGALVLADRLLIAWEGPDLSVSTHNPRWKAQVETGGFPDLVMTLRVWDERPFLGRPIAAADLSWRGRYDPGGVVWSKDGTLVVAWVKFHSGSSGYSGGYDFKERRVLESGDRSPERPSPEFEQEVERLLKERGGRGERVKPPEIG
jgi:hypothetical protein